MNPERELERWIAARREHALPPPEETSAPQRTGLERAAALIVVAIGIWRLLHVLDPRLPAEIWS